MIRTLGPINAHRCTDLRAADTCRPADPLYPVSWLPLAVPKDNPKFYTFKIKRLLGHFLTQQQFLDSRGCKATFEILSEIKSFCDSENIRFILAYAPDKPHVLLPLVKDDLPAEKVRAFMALKAHNLPPADRLIDTLISRLGIQESATEQFCREHSIEFVTLTEPLRRQILQGRQVYFTYDQHWTPIGQEIAAETIARFLAKNPQPQSQ